MPADIELWEEYIEYCQSLHKEKKVDTIFQSYLIFILDFYHYILIMKDFVLKHVNGRLIMVMFQLQEVFLLNYLDVMQNCIRLNPKSIYLHTEYFRMELM